MADIFNLIPKNTNTVNLRHPVTGEVLVCSDKTKMTIEVIGKDARQYRKIQADLLRAKIDKKNKSLSAEQVDEFSTEQLASCIVSWNIEYNGEKPALSIQKATEILDEVRWMREQTADAIDDRADFLKNQASC